MEENWSNTDLHEPTNILILQVGLLIFSLLKVLLYQEMSAVHEHQQINIFEQKCDDRLDMHQFSPRMEFLDLFVQLHVYQEAEKHSLWIYVQ